MTIVNQAQQPEGIARATDDEVTVGRELRRVFGRFATGVTVVTAGRATPSGMTANAFSSVSLDPPLALVCVKHNASVHDTIIESGSFAVSVLAAHQEEVARLFADHSRPRGQHEFDAVDARPGPYSGAPVLSGALAWLDCKLAAVHEGGDHSIFVGEVQTIGRGTADEALLFYDGAFHRIEPEAEIILRKTA